MVITKKILIIPLTLKAYFNLHKLYYLSKNSQNFWPGLLKPPTMNNLWKYLISRFLIFFSLFQHSINSALPISFFFLGAFLNHQLIGTSFLIFTKNKEIAELGICVIDEFQNKGIGTKLINHLILHAKHMGINKLYLTVSPYNLIALVKEKPDLVIVYGDCNSTLAGALAAVKVHLKIAHVEAGYRSYDKSMPEEVNRRLTDHISDLLFAPTSTAVRNLKKENVQGIIHLTGDVMVDVLLQYKNVAERKSNILTRLGVDQKNYIVVTVHREENTEERQRLANIVEALIKIAEGYRIVFPIHPRTKNALIREQLYNKLINNEKIIVIPPLNYLDFVKLESNALKIITDSGGVQKEAYVLGIPCITLRNTTEVYETVREGFNVLVDVDIKRILNAIETFNIRYNKRRNSLGKGNAAMKIIQIIRKSI